MKIMNNQNPQQHYVPDSSIGTSFSFGWKQLWKYFLYLFLVSIIIAVLQVPMGVADSLKHDITPGVIVLQVFALFYWLLLFPIFSYGADLLYLRAIRDEEIDLKEMFIGFKNYVNIILAHLLATAIIGLGFVFFIIPGIIFACRLVFVPYIVMDRNLDAVKAVEKSWKMTAGNGWKIFGMGVLSFFIILLGLIMLIVGVFPAAMWVSTAFASLYHSIDHQEKMQLENGNGA
jgi:uncharacterized membrane protein